MDHTNIFKLNIENEFYQILETSANVTFKIKNAYYDDREVLTEKPLVRLMTFIHGNFSAPDIYCQFRFEGLDTPVSAPVINFHLMWKFSGTSASYSYSYLISCLSPEIAQNVKPHYVSLVENPCDEATNHLKIINNRPKNNTKKQFAVCVKDMNLMEDKTTLLVEWIEINLLLGAERIFFYVNQTHPNAMKMLKYYETQGIVKIEPASSPKGLPDKLTQRRQFQVASLTDCLYKNMYEFEYILPLDIDELMMPVRREDRTWSDLIARVKTYEKYKSWETQLSAIAGGNTYFLLDNDHQGELQPEIPDNLHFMQHIYRARKYPNAGPKSFQITEKVLSVHNHLPMACVDPKRCQKLYMETDDAQLQHYRISIGCNICMNFLNDTVKDVTLWKFKDELLENFDRTLKALESL